MVSAYKRFDCIKVLYDFSKLQKRIYFDLFSSQLAMFMNPVAAYMYDNSSVLVDTYKPLGTFLVSIVSNRRVQSKPALRTPPYYGQWLCPLAHTFSLKLTRLVR